MEITVFLYDLDGCMEYEGVLILESCKVLWRFSANLTDQQGVHCRECLFREVLVMLEMSVTSDK